MPRESIQNQDLINLLENNQVNQAFNEEEDIRVEKERFHQYLQTALSKSKKEEFEKFICTEQVKELLFKAIERATGNNQFNVQRVIEIVHDWENGSISQKQMNDKINKQIDYSLIEPEIKLYKRMINDKKKIEKMDVLRYRISTVNTYNCQLQRGKSIYIKNPFSTETGVIKAYRNFIGEFVSKLDIDNLIDDLELYNSSKSNLDISEDSQQKGVLLRKFLEYISEDTRKIDKDSTKKFLEKIRSLEERDSYIEVIKLYFECKNISNIDIDSIMLDIERTQTNNSNLVFEENEEVDRISKEEAYSMIQQLQEEIEELKKRIL